MNAIPWYRSPVFTLGLTAALLQLAPLLDAVFIERLLSGQTAAVSQLISFVLSAIVVGVRAVATEQPITLTKTTAETANVRNQGGFARPLLLAMLLGSAVLAVPVLQGCQFLGVTQPKSFRDDYAYALAQVTAVRKTATDLLNARQLSVADAEYVLKTTDQARAYLDTARGVYEAGETVKGQSGLELATNVLLQLQTFLNARAT